MESRAEMSCVMKVNINCETCRKKVMEVLQNLRGVYSVVIDADKGTLKVSGKVNPYIILTVFEKYGKHGEVSCVKFDGEVREPLYYPYYGSAYSYPHMGGPLDYYYSSWHDRHRYPPIPPFPPLIPPTPPPIPAYLPPRPPPPLPLAPRPPPQPQPQPVINYFPPKAPPVVAPPKELDPASCIIM